MYASSDEQHAVLEKAIHSMLQVNTGTAASNDAQKETIVLLTLVQASSV